MTETRVATADCPMCIQYHRTASGKWRVIVHGLTSEPFVSSQELEELPFTSPAPPKGEPEKKRLNISARSPFTFKDIQDEELIISVLRSEGYSEKEINWALKRRREAGNGTIMEKPITVP